MQFVRGRQAGHPQGLAGARVELVKQVRNDAHSPAVIAQKRGAERSAVVRGDRIQNLGRFFLESIEETGLKPLERPKALDQALKRKNVLRIAGRSGKAQKN